MRYLLVVSLLAFATPVSAQSWSQVETEHLVVFSVPDVPAEAVEMAKQEGERFYAALVDLLGSDAPPKVNILLEGNAERPDGRWRYPHVDRFGRVHLYQFSPDLGSYFTALAHEMVHAFRIRRPNKDWFFEEGFAEFVALRVDESLGGFPWFDTPVDVVAGQWLARGEAVPLSLLREKHRELNQTCKAQAYALRSSFFVWLGDEFGEEKVLEMAARDDAGQDYAVVFGEDFATLTARWREAQKLRYDSIENAEALAKAYRESPIQYQKVCREGEDF